jgi:hypothetical protein
VTWNEFIKLDSMSDIRYIQHKITYPNLNGMNGVTTCQDEILVGYQEGLVYY